LAQSDIKTFQNAAKRWKQLVVGDVADVQSSGYEMPLSGCTAPNVINDLLICGEVAPIDGEYNVLGYAGPYWLRGNNIPCIGQMAFDLDDVERMKEENTYYPVILHEMGHVMGIGSIWEGTGITGSSRKNCPYRGANGNREYQAISGCTSRTLPTEQDGGGSTRCGHFSEDCFKDEVMTGYATDQCQ
jgi:trimeric autotransporter adhesin